MRKDIIRKLRNPWLVFVLILSISIMIGGAASFITPAGAASDPVGFYQEGGTFTGPETCQSCHPELYDTWKSTRHAEAFSSPIFQQDWESKGSTFPCLECHTTGFDGENQTYAHEGVTCEILSRSFPGRSPQRLDVSCPRCRALRYLSQNHY